MIPRVRCVSVAVLALLAAASSCLAAEGYGPGRGGVGAQIGGSKFFADADYSEGAQPRFSFAANFRYGISKHWRWQVTPGFTWAAYKEVPAPFRDPSFPRDSTKTQYLSLILPVSAQLQYVMQRGSWLYHAGVGPGVYRVWVENRRKVLKDPVSLKLHRGTYPGASAQIGAERFLKGLPSTSIEFTVAAHMAFAQRDEQFPSGYNSNVGTVEGRIGANYYFDLVRPKKTQELPASPGTP